MHTHIKELYPLIPYHMATTMLSMFYVFRWIPQDALCCHTYKPQIVEHVWETCYGPHSVTLGGVPNTNHSSYSRHKINTSPSTTYDCSIEWRPSIRATTRTLTPAILANPSYNSRNARVHPPSRATTQGMPFRATTQGMSHVYPLSRATTQGTLQQVDL